MVWLPARPSPIAAPIAPPPRASPPPTRAPAMRTADATVSVVAIFFYSSWVGLVRGLERDVVRFFMARGHAEVQDCQQHEDERLNRSKQTGVQELPADFEGGADGER